MAVSAYQAVVTTYIQPYAKQYGGDPQFLQIVAAGTKAESQWNVNAEQNPGANSGAKGLFQFDLAGMGAPWKSNYNALLGDTGAKLEAAQIVPIYEALYTEGTAKGLVGQDLATYVIGGAQKPAGWTPGAVRWNDNTYNNYVSNWQGIMASPGTNMIFQPNGTVIGPGGTVIQIPSTTAPPQGTGSTPGSSIVTQPGGTTDTPGTTGSSTQVQPTQILAGTAGQIQAGLLGFFGTFAGKFAAGWILVIASIFMILIGAIIWNGDKVKQYAPKVAVAAATA